MASRKKKSSSAKATAGRVKVAARQLKATSKRLQQTSKQLQTKARPSKSQPKRKAQKSKSTSKQITASVEAIKKLTAVFRDAAGRFAKRPSKPSKQRKAKAAQPKPSKKAAPVTSPKATARKKTQKSTPVKTTPKQGRKSIGVSSRQIEKALRESSKKKPTPPPAKKQPKKPFTLRSLKPGKGEKLVEFFSRVEDNEEAIDRLKGENDYWAFTYANGKSRKLYRNIGLAVRHMRGYELSKAIANAQAEEDEDADEQRIADDLYDSISFVRWEGTPLEYVIPNEERIRERKAERIRIRRAAEKLVGKQPKGFAGNIDLVEQLTKLLEKERNKNAAIRPAETGATKTHAGSKGKKQATAGVQRKGSGKAKKASRKGKGSK